MTSDALPSFWPSRRLDDLLARPLAYGVLKPGEYVEGGVPLVRIQDVHTGYLDAGRMHRISPALHSEFRRTMLVGGELLLSIVGTLGKVVEVPEGLSGANISRALCVLGPSGEIERRFLGYVLTSARVQDWIAQEGRGNAQAVLNLGILRELIVQVPPLEEQRQISTVLSSVDDVIRGTQAVIDQLQVVKKAMMAELLTRGLPGRHTRFKQTEVGEVPEGWDVGRLRDYAALASGGTPSRDRPDFWGGGIPWVKTGEITYGIVTETEETISSLGLENSSAKMLPPGILLMAMYGQGVTRGRVALLGVPATVNQACLAILPSGRVSARFLFHVFTDRYEALRELGHEGTQKNLNAGLVGDVLIPVPSSDEQEIIATALDQVRSRIERENLAMTQMAAVKSALMSVLLTGEVRVTPDEAPA